MLNYYNNAMKKRRPRWGRIRSITLKKKLPPSIYEVNHLAERYINEKKRVL